MVRLLLALLALAAPAYAQTAAEEVIESMLGTSGKIVVVPIHEGTLFNSLPIEDNGSIRNCPDCSRTDPCTGGGTGAVAERENGVWNCGGGGGGGGSGDITAIWTATSGDVSALTAASGDTFNATGADSTAPCKTGTTVPPTCTVGQCFFDTDATAGQNVYGCTATNTWSQQGGATSGDITAVWTTTTGNVDALTAAAGDTLDAANADFTKPFKIGTTPPATCSIGELFYDSDATIGNNLYGCVTTNNWMLQGDGGGVGAGDITAVWNCTSGDCDAITADAGDTLNASAADSTIACKSGTSPPGTCAVGECFFDTDATAGQNQFGCTATNVWTLQGDGVNTGDLTAIWTGTTGNIDALTAAAGDSLNAEAADSTAPCKSGTAPPGTCQIGDCFYDTNETAGLNLFWCTASNTWTLEGDGAGGGSGDVTGPAVSVDNAVTRFNGITGKVIQESPVTIDDSGNITSPGFITVGSDLGPGILDLPQGLCSAPALGTKLRICGDTTNGIVLTAGSTAQPITSLGSDAGTARAQTIQSHNINTGTLNTASPTLTIQSGKSTGNAAGGAIIFRTSPAAGSGTAQNAQTQVGQIDQLGFTGRITASALNVPSVTAFPGSPVTGDVVVVTDDSVTGACDSAAGSAKSVCRWSGSAWQSIGDGGAGGGTGDITDVWGCTTGDCAALTAASGDTLDASAANTTKACKSGTARPGTCSVGECFFDTDEPAGQNSYGCTSTDVWTLQGGGNVAGPASSTDNAIARYDATTGKIIQNSTIIANDSGSIFAPAGFTTPAGNSLTNSGVNVGNGASYTSTAGDGKSIGLYGERTVLVDNTSTQIVNLSSTANKYAFVHMFYAVVAQDATNSQTEVGEIFFACAVNSGGTTTVAPSALTSGANTRQALTAGTLSSQFQAVANGSTCDLKATVDTSLTTTNFKLYWHMLRGGG